jgi:multidrug resistance efflux pump
MGLSFSSSMRSLANDKFSSSFLMTVVAVALLGLWIAWLVLARVSVYETSEAGRIEVDTSLYPIAAPVSGKVLNTYVTLGREVQAGDTLIEFEAEDERLRLDEARTQIVTLAPQLVALRDEVEAEEIARKEQLKSARIAIDQARSQLDEAQASVQHAEEEAGRIARLQAQGLLSEADLSRAQIDVRKRKAAAESARLQIDKLQADLQNRDSDSQVRIERLKREIASVEGQVTTATATSNRFAHDIEKRALRAPVSGRIGEAVDLRAGALVNASDKVGVIIPSGELKAIAYFRPSSAVGRIQPGQSARLRLEGFPWTQYGVIKATVTTVASEPREGRIRVDMALELDPASAIPFQHGLPATVEIEVARVSPATLLLRAVGERIKPAEADKSGAKVE